MQRGREPVALAHGRGAAAGEHGVAELQRPRGRRLRGRVDREGRGEALGHLGGAEHVADAEAGHRVQLGEGAEDEQVGQLGDEAGGVLARLEEVGQRLVEQHPHALADPLAQRAHVLARDRRAGRVVGARERDRARVRARRGRPAGRCRPRPGQTPGGPRRAAPAPAAGPSPATPPAARRRRAAAPRTPPAAARRRRGRPRPARGRRRGARPRARAPRARPGPGRRSCAAAARTSRR